MSWALRAERVALAGQSSCRATGGTEEVRGQGPARGAEAGVAGAARPCGRRGGWETVIPRA